MNPQQKLSKKLWDSDLLDFQPREPWLAILGLAFFVGLSLVAGGAIAIVTFPLGSLLVGWLLYSRYPLLYCGFTWWLWFAGSLVRRIIDYRCGYLTPGPWTLTATLVTSISVLSLIKYLPIAHKQNGVPFVIASSCCLYGWIISLVNDGFVDRGIFILFEWLAPIAFAFHILLQWRDYPRYRQNMQRTFVWGALIMGSYGIIQYIVAPSWDRFWINRIDELGTKSFGLPEPFGIRVSSMMDSPQSFAAMITACLLLVLSVQQSRNLWANGIGYLSFLLSLARSAWLGWFVSMFIFFQALKLQLKIRLLVSIFLGILMIFPVTRIEPFSTVISERIESFTNTETDTSYKARLGGYSQLIDLAATEFTGKGIKNPIEPDVDLKVNFVVFDNGILTLLFSLGWVGSTPYVLSIVLLVVQIRQSSLKNKDLVLSAAYALIVGSISQIFLKTITNGSMAMILWGFIGIGMCGQNYYLYLSQIDSQNKALK